MNKIAGGYIHKSAGQCIQYPKGEADAYNNIAIGSTILGNPEKGQECFEKALEIFEKSGDKSGILRALNNLESFYRRLNNYKKALEYYQLFHQTDEEILADFPCHYLYSQ